LPALELCLHCLFGACRPVHFNVRSFTVPLAFATLTTVKPTDCCRARRSVSILQ
jgi:hypothetical protein